MERNDKESLAEKDKDRKCLPCFKCGEALGCVLIRTDEYTTSPRKSEKWN